MKTEQARKPLLARIVSLEGAMAAFGAFSLGVGLWDGEALQIFWGGVILCGLGVLIAVRRRDWQKHWEEMSAIAARRSQPGNPLSGEISPRQK